MAICVECYSDYPDKRKSLGYNKCIICGDKDAVREVKRKSRCTAPLFNKGAFNILVI